MVQSGDPTDRGCQVDPAYVDGLMGVEAVAVDGKVDLEGFRVLVESLRHGQEEQVRLR